MIIQKNHNSLISLAGTIFSVILLLIASGISYSQNYIKSNYEILEEEVSAELEKFFFYPDVNRERQFVFFVKSPANSKPAESKNEKKFIEYVIRKVSEKNSLRFSFAKDEKMESTDSVYNKVNIVIRKIKTSYPKLVKNRFLGEKTLQRELECTLDVSVTGNKGAILVSDKLVTAYKDEIPYDDYEKYQNPDYRFTQSEPPDISFIETILFPVVIITVSAAATILFFTIRSK